MRLVFFTTSELLHGCFYSVRLTVQLYSTIQTMNQNIVTVPIFYAAISVFVLIVVWMNLSFNAFMNNICKLWKNGKVNIKILALSYSTLRQVFFNSLFTYSIRCSITHCRQFRFSCSYKIIFRPLLCITQRSFYIISKAMFSHRHNINAFLIQVRHNNAFFLYCSVSYSIKVLLGV